MNVYEAMGRIVDYAISYLDIVPDTTASNEDVATIAQLLDAYAELAPDWANAPDNADWYTIDCDGDVNWHDEEPVLNGYHWYSRGRHLIDGIDLPLGIDWRLCKWQRPEVTK